MKMEYTDLMRVYHSCLQSDEGIMILQDLQARFNGDTTTFVKGDPHESAFLEGQRSVMLYIMEMLSEDRLTKIMVRKKNG